MSSADITPPTSIRIGETAVGRGVFATEDIAEGDTIEVCPVVVLGEGDAEGVLADYVVGVEDNPDGAALMLGYGSLYNSTWEPNAQYVLLEDDAYAFEALRDIAAGEQITIDYGEEWWRTRDKEPDDL